MKLFQSKPKEKKTRTVGLFREYFELIAETLVFVFFVMTFLLQSFVIPTSSMEDTLLIGDHLLVDKIAYSRSLTGLERLLLPQTPIRRGMIVTFKAPHDLGKEYVKRVIGLPGETVQLIEKKVYINGRLLPEPYVYFKGYGSIDNFPPANAMDWYYTFPFEFRSSLADTPFGKAFRVPQGHYFCMGDNRDNSSDCRYWGPVPADYIVGKPWRIYWSYDSTSSEYLTPGIAHKARDLFQTALSFFSKTRWNRTIKKVS